MTIVRFGIADNLIWADRSDLRGASAMRDGTRIWNYDIHGIVAITSESRLPELVRVPGAGAARSGRHPGRRQQRGLRRAPPHDRRRRGGLHGLLRRAPRAARVRHEDQRRHPGAHPGVEAVASVAPRCLHERGRAGGAVGHGAQGLHPRARGMPADRRARRADHGADRHGQDHDVPEVDQGTGHRVRVRRHGDHRSSGQRAVLSQAADDLVAHPERRQGRADARCARARGCRCRVVCTRSSAAPSGWRSATSTCPSPR